MQEMFQEGDLVMAHLQQSHFPGIRAKLEKHNYGLFSMAQKINDNASVLQLPGISLTYLMWKICSNII